MDFTAVFGKVDLVAVAALLETDFAQVDLGGFGRRLRRRRYGSGGGLSGLAAEMGQEGVEPAVEAAGDDIVAPDAVLSVELAEDERLLLDEALAGEAVIGAVSAAAERDDAAGDIAHGRAVGGHGNDQLLNLIRHTGEIQAENRAVGPRLHGDCALG